MGFKLPQQNRPSASSQLLGINRGGNRERVSSPRHPGTFVAIGMTHLMSVCISQAPGGRSHAWDPLVCAQRQSLPWRSHNINRGDRVRTGGKQRLSEGLADPQQSSVGSKPRSLSSLCAVTYTWNPTAFCCTRRKNKKSNKK